MGSSDGKYGIEHALGKTVISRINNPSIRGSVRRADPDGGHASPYFLGLTAKTLDVEVSPVVGDIAIVFVSDDMDDAIATINAASPANLKAEDDDGYLRLTNLNSGGKNKLIIKSGTSVDILGFMVNPEPGSASFAGELSTSPPGRSITAIQNNPQGTVLVANDEDLTSKVLNRAIYGALRHIERLTNDLDIEVPIVKRIAVNVVSHVPTGKKVFVIQDGTLRFPIQGFGLSGNPAPTEAFDKLVSLRTSPDDLEVIDPLNVGGIPRVSSVYYNDGTNATADNTTNFVAWGTIDGKSIFASQTKNKQAPVAITAIRGNILIAPTAQFVTNVCQPGDTAIIEAATNNIPFNHDGEYVIVEVLSETKLVVRPKSLHETTFVSTEKPTELNTNLPGGTAYGDIRVIVGATLPMSNLMFEVDSWVPVGAYFARVLCFRRIRDLLVNELGEVLNPGNASLGTLLNTHFTGAGAHAAINITADAVAGAPHSLLAGTVDAQLATIIGFLNALNATMVSYAGGGNWADGTANPATTVELQLDKIVADLAADTGAIKIGANTGPAWADATANPAATVEARLDKIITDLAGAAGSAKIQGVVVGTDLAVGTIQAQIADLAVNWLKMGRANTIAGAQTFAALLTANLGISVPTGQAVTLVGTTTLSVGGLITATGGLTAGALITASAGISVPTGQNVTLVGTADLKHGDRVLNIPGSAGLPIVGGGGGTLSGSVRYEATGYEASIETTAAVGTILWNVPLKTGDRVKSVTFRVKSVSGGTVNSGVGAADIIIRSNAGGSTFIGSVGAQNITVAMMDITINVTDTTLANGDVLICALATLLNDVYIQNVQVTYDRP